MRVHRLRSAVQLMSFLILTYGSRTGLRFGHFLPCFACPYVGGCPGHCYLMALQSPQFGFQLPIAEMAGMAGLHAIGMFLGFSVLVLLLSKTWCGWICPFGSLQDWIASLRRRLGIRESSFRWTLREQLKPIKYILLILLIVIPVAIAHGALHSDFKLPFCQICPAKPIMPVFMGDFRHFGLDTTNEITMVMTTLSLTLTAAFLAGMFFKDRFFCIFCPLLALISLYDRIGLVRLRKRVDSCKGCGNCERICPANIRKVHTEMEKEDVLTQDCLECFRCAESCPGDGTLFISVLGRRLFSSSSSYLGDSFRRAK